MSQDVLDAARRAREASHGLALATRAQKDAALLAMADALLSRAGEVLDANADDVARAEADGTPANTVDRLRLTRPRLEDMARGLREVGGAARPGRRGGPRQHAGQRAGAAAGAGAVRRRRDDLRGPAQRHRGRRRDLPEVRQRGTAAGLVVGQLQQRGDRRGAARRRSSRPVSTRTPSSWCPATRTTSVKALMRARGLVDVLIPRGGAGLIRSVVEESTVPVIETGVGNCHVYVDRAADLDKALAIVLNAKTQRTSVCNAAESLLVHADVADEFLPAGGRRAPGGRRHHPRRRRVRGVRRGA